MAIDEHIEFSYMVSWDVRKSVPRLWPLTLAIACQCGGLCTVKIVKDEAGN